jgi:hypothetical protein
MIAVITGDIMASRSLSNQEQWIKPLKKLLGKWGKSPAVWKLDRGDFFQVEVAAPETALLRAFQIKTLIKSVLSPEPGAKRSTLDVRMGIGIGEKTYTGASISESNGAAFIHSGEKFDALQREAVRIGITTPWPHLDEEINLYLKLLGIIIDRWSVSSAELVAIVLQYPQITQEAIGQKLGIRQNSVSGRWNRARIDELLEVENIFRRKISHQLS